MKDIFYKVAGLVFRVRLPDTVDACRFLPSFRPFVYEYDGEETAFSFNVHTEQFSELTDDRYILLEDFRNDVGRVLLYSSGCGYCIGVSYRDDGKKHYALSDKMFSHVGAYIDMDDIDAGNVVCSMLRLVFSQAVILHGGISVHASCVCLDGRAYLFMGKSGTGKSTHSRLWLESFEGCRLLNDDNPVIRIAGDKVMAYGTPWSGKTPCYINNFLPVAGMVRLKQADINRFRVCLDSEAFVNLLPGCSVLRKDRNLYDRFCDTLAEISGMITVGMLECLPDRDAAVLCREELMKNRKNLI